VIITILLQLLHRRIENSTRSNMNVVSILGDWNQMGIGESVWCTREW